MTIKLSKPGALLIFSISLGIISALYPYSPAINPEGKGVGVDIHSYVDYVHSAEIVEKDISQAFRVSDGSRPVIFMLIYGFQGVTGSDAFTAVKFLPIILNPLMIAASFFLALQAFGDEWVAAWTAFFTACGYQVTVGMYSYFLTNMLALSLAFLSLGFLFRSLRRDCNTSLSLASILGVLLVFTHPWMSNQYGATTILTIIISYNRTRKKKGSYENTKRTLLYIASLGLSDLAKTLLLHGSGAISASSTVISNISSLPEFWLDSIFSFRLRFGGTLSVFILVGLAVLGVYLSGFGEFSEIYFTIFLVLTSLLFPIGDKVIKSRLLYNVPIGLFAAIGMSSLSRWKFNDNFKKFFILFVVLNLTVYLFRSLANLV